MLFYALICVQLDGIPEAPLGHGIVPYLMKVPVEYTLPSQLSKQFPVDGTVVARHLTHLKFVQL